MQTVLQRPGSSRAFLNKLSALVRAAEGVRLLLDSDEDISAKPFKVAKPQEKAPAGMRSILKKGAEGKSFKPLTDKASDMRPLKECSLRGEDWPLTLLLKGPAVLSKLRRCDPPVAAIMTEQEAEEAAAYWEQHELGEERSLSAICHLWWHGPPSLVASAYSMAQFDPWRSRCRSFCSDFAAVQPSCGQEGRRPSPSPSQRQSETVQLTVFARYAVEKLSAKLAGDLLRKAWPKDDKTKAARQFAP